MVYSGIAPPPQLLEAMAEARAGIRHNSVTEQASEKPAPEKPKMETGRTSDFGAGQVPPTPIAEAGPSTVPEMPARPGTGTEELPPMYSEAPPSYEDAVATGLRPVDTPRPEYAPPPAGEDDVLRRDEKTGWVG